MEGFLLKEFLFSYGESYVLEVDLEGMIGVKKIKMASIRKHRRRFFLKNSVSKIKMVLS
jgi:hypothetical protein